MMQLGVGYFRLIISSFQLLIVIQKQKSPR
jgi:hypothetical protein